MRILILFALAATACLAQETQTRLILVKATDTNVPAEPPGTIVTSNGDLIILPKNPEPFAPLKRDKPGLWSFGAWDDPHPLRTNYEVFHDKTWLITEGVWLGSIVYDVELTHEGFAHHMCPYGTGNLAPGQTRSELYRSNIPEFAAGTAFNWLLLKYVNKALTFPIPTWGSATHFERGSKWLQNCW